MAVVGAAGGEVTLTAADGTLYRLQVPAGATGRGCHDSIETAEPPPPASVSGLRPSLPHLHLRPASPAALVLEPPAAQPFATGFVLRWSGIPLSLRRAADGSIQTTLVALPGRAVTTARATAARVRALADTAQPCELTDLDRRTTSSTPVRRRIPSTSRLWRTACWWRRIS